MDSPNVVTVERIDLPVIESYLNARMRYLAARFKKSPTLKVAQSMEIRLGAEVAQNFHYDSGAVVMVEALNRGNQSGGTYFVGKNGKVFENPPGHALLIAGSDQVVGPPALHAAPPSGTERIFFRYGITDRTNRKRPDAIYQYR